MIKSILTILFSLFALAIPIGLNNTPGNPTNFLFFSPSSNHSLTIDTWLLFYLYLSMLLGILASNLHSSLIEYEKLKKNNEPKSLSRIFVSQKLYTSLLISPIVFSSVYLMTKGQPDIVILIIFSFENGFFWDVVSKHKSQTQET